MLRCTASFRLPAYLGSVSARCPHLPLLTFESFFGVLALAARSKSIRTPRRTGEAPSFGILVCLGVDQNDVVVTKVAMDNASRMQLLDGCREHRVNPTFQPLSGHGIPSTISLMTDSSSFIEAKWARASPAGLKDESMMNEISERSRVRQRRARSSCRVELAHNVDLFMML